MLSEQSVIVRLDETAVKTPPELRVEEQLAKESEIMCAYIEAEEE